MTPRQLTNALTQLGLTQVAAGRMLGVTGRTIRYYVAGDRAISLPVAKLLRLALAGKVTTDDIDRAEK